MLLSLSVRIVEEFSSKERASMDLATLAPIAAVAGYHALCMRGSQVGVHSNPDRIHQAARVISSQGLKVSMVTGDFPIVYNNERGPDCLRNIEPYLDLAMALGANLVRVALKTPGDIPLARTAAELAGKRGIHLVHQCHVESLFETVNGIENTLRSIDHPNFGLVFEPANLELCGQDYGPATIRRLAPWIRNVYLQNQRLNNSGSITLNTWCRGKISFDLLPVSESGGIQFDPIFAGLAAIGYEGPLTVHQSGIPGVAPGETCSKTAHFLKSLAADHGLK